jgi:glycosyltransferase involved in cell wall biosynthesis
MKKINLQCPIGYTGYGITSLNILNELYKISHVSLFPMGKININNNDEIATLKQCISNSRLYDKNATCVKIWHQHDLASRIGSGKYCSFPFFELDTLSEIETHNINSCDTVFTATEWSKQILLDNGVTIPIVVCPLGVDRKIFNENNPKTNDKYVFCHIGKWEKRKSQDILLKCFEKAFSINDNVELWLFPHNPFLTEDETKYWIDMVKYNKLSSKITIFPRYDSQNQLANTISQADCGVFISRAEGWNNEILEVMSMNKPCIVTNYSAHTHYCDKNNSFLIDIQDKELANDDKWFFGQGSWAKIGQREMDNVIETMRYVYNNNIRSNPAGIETSKKYSWTKTAEIIYANT